MKTFLFLILIISIAYSTTRLCSFNVQVFGTTKMENEEVVQVLVKVFNTCDIIFMMEIRDSTGEAIEELLRRVNEVAPPGDEFEMVVSERLGRTTSQEQYAYFYRKKIVSIEKVKQYDDETDLFERPPFGIVAKVKGTKMFFYGIHDSPGNAVSEIYSFLDTFITLTKNRTIPNFGIMFGDFNSGCRYVGKRDLEALQTHYKELGFEWLIGDDVKTMVATDCPYDRFMIGTKYSSKVGNIKPYYYDQDFNITQDLASLVSDHYPITLDINL